MFGKDMHTLAKEVLILNTDSPPLLMCAWSMDNCPTQNQITVVYKSLFSLLQYNRTEAEALIQAIMGLKLAAFTLGGFTEVSAVYKVAIKNIITFYLNTVVATIFHTQSSSSN